VHEAEGDALDLPLRVLDLRVVASPQAIMINDSITALESTAKTGPSLRTLKPAVRTYCPNMD